MTSVLKGWRFDWRPYGYLHIEKDLESSNEYANQANRSLAWIFNGYERGWYIGYDGHYDRLNVPPESISVDPLTRDEIIENAIRELERRIEREPDVSAHRKSLIWYLFNIGRLDAALELTLEWIRLSPSQREARKALFDIEYQRRTGQRFLARTCRNYQIPASSYVSWRLCHFPSQRTESYESALQLPFTLNDIEWSIAEYIALDDASWLLMSQKIGDLIELCNKWEAESQKHLDTASDRSYLTFRAAGHLAQKEFDKARADLERLDNLPEDAYLICAPSYELRTAIVAGKHDFWWECYPDMPTIHVEWQPNLDISFPPQP